MSNTLSKSSRRVRHILSVRAGNLIQAAGFGLGCVALWFSTQPNNGPSRVTTMIVGYLLIYFTSHASAHYIAGRFGRIQFSHYSVSGSSHATSYPPGMRQLFERLPFLKAHTNPESLKSADSTARAFMFGAGIISTVVFSSSAALFVFQADVPGSLSLLIFNGIWQVSSLIAEMRPGGDLAKAAKAFRSP